ncbi:MAG: winged helix DNA-binding protein [Eubacteriales bacterium]|nr:winged helix DNA-binding protein [Eubacteriales bacterium]
MADLREELVGALSRIYGMESIEAFAEFYQGELHVLQYLFLHSGERIYPSSISDALFVTRARVTAALSSLRRKGFVRMEIYENDRRRMTVSLTKDGVAFVREKQKNVMGHFDKLIKILGETDTKALIKIIHKCANASVNNHAGVGK